MYSSLYTHYLHGTSYLVDQVMLLCLNFVSVVHKLSFTFILIYNKKIIIIIMTNLLQCIISWANCSLRVFVADSTNGRAYATMLRPSFAVSRL